MPKYDYKCDTCHSVIEFERGFGEDREPVCCSKSMSRVWNSAPSIMFNGSGFYSTDNRKQRYTQIMSLIVKDHPSVKQKEWSLKATDRCDSCGAQAYVSVKGSTGDLMFCGHHYEKIMNNPDAYTKMMSFMLEVTDERERLIENKAIGSAN